MKDLVIIGAGDFGREVVHLVERINLLEKRWNLLGFIDDQKELQGKVIDGVKVIGDSEWLKKRDEEIYAVCSIGVGTIRKKVIDNLDGSGVKFATLIDPDAILFKNASVGEGSIICAGTIVSINVKINKHVIVNWNCTLGHDDIVDSFCTINPGVNISGKVNVNQCTDLGTGTKVIQGIEIGEKTITGAGAVIVRDVPGNCLVVGCPAKIIKTYD